MQLHNNLKLFSYGWFFFESLFTYKDFLVLFIILPAKQSLRLRLPPPLRVTHHHALEDRTPISNAERSYFFCHRKVRLLYVGATCCVIFTSFSYNVHAFALLSGRLVPEKHLSFSIHHVWCCLNKNV